MRVGRRALHTAHRTAQAVRRMQHAARSMLQGRRFTARTYLHRQPARGANYVIVRIGRDERGQRVAAECRLLGRVQLPYHLLAQAYSQ